MKLGVIGCGKVGMNTLRAFAAKGYDVLGYDISQSAQNGIVECLGRKGLAVELEYLSCCDIVFECVPTDPVAGTAACDLSALESTVRRFAQLEVRSEYNCKLFVQRSTCPPGTARKLLGQFSKTDYAVNPKRRLSGKIPFLRNVSR